MIRSILVAANEAQSLVNVESNSLSGLWGEGGRRPGEGAAGHGDASVGRPMLLAALMIYLLCFAAFSLAQDTPQAYVGARILPINGREIPEGVLVVHQGKIVTVGPATSTSVPADAQRHDVKGKVIMPGSG